MGLSPVAGRVVMVADEGLLVNPSRSGRLVWCGFWRGRESPVGWEDSGATVLTNAAFT